MKKLLLIWALLFSMLLTGCVKDKEFSGTGYTITLRSNFKKFKELPSDFDLDQGYVDYYEAPKAAIAVSRVQRSLLGGMSLSSVFSEYKYANMHGGTIVYSEAAENEIDYYFYTFTSELDGDSYYNQMSAMASPIYYYLFHFLSVEEAMESYSEYFHLFSKSVVFN